jgi:uncharacterized membrane protein (DUF4010 family)
LTDPSWLDSEPIRVSIQFLTSLCVGLLLGLERQRQPGTQAGVRTFALIAVFGTICGLLAQRVDSTWLIATGLLCVAAMLLAAHRGSVQASGDAGATTIIAGLICFGLGAMIWYEYRLFAVGLAVVVTVLLHFREELHGFSDKLTAQDIASVLRFAVLTFVVLPLLPNQGYGPYGALNPYHIWTMVVLISAVSLAGYLAFRLAGQRRGVILTGLLGGLVSSTATTLVQARAARDNRELMVLSRIVIVTASLVGFLRVTVLVAITAPSVLRHLAPVLALGLIVGVAFSVRDWRRMEELPALATPQLTNPANLHIALSFGVLYGVVLLVSAWLTDVVGSAGLYGLAMIAGLTDVDPVTLSSAQLATQGKIGEEQAAIAIGLALSANLALKTALVFVAGNSLIGRQCAVPLIATLLGALLGLAIFL